MTEVFIGRCDEGVSERVVGERRVIFFDGNDWVEESVDAGAVWDGAGGRKKRSSWQGTFEEFDKALGVQVATEGGKKRLMKRIEKMVNKMVGEAIFKTDMEMTAHNVMIDAAPTIGQYRETHTGDQEALKRTVVRLKRVCSGLNRIGAKCFDVNKDRLEQAQRDVAEAQKQVGDSPEAAGALGVLYSKLSMSLNMIKNAETDTESGFATAIQKIQEEAESLESGPHPFGCDELR